MKTVDLDDTEDGGFIPYCIMSTVSGDVLFQDLYSYTLTSDAEAYDVLKENGADYSFPIVGEKVTIIGIYEGFSEVYNMPACIYGCPDLFFAYYTSPELFADDPASESSEDLSDASPEAPNESLSDESSAQDGDAPTFGQLNALEKPRITLLRLPFLIRICLISLNTKALMTMRLRMVSITAALIGLSKHFAPQKSI